MTNAQARLRELNQRLLSEGSYRVTTLASYQNNMWMTARGLGLLLVFAVGIAETASGRTTPGTLAAFVLTAMLFYSALGFMLDFYTMAAPAAGALAADRAAAGQPAGCAGGSPAGARSGAPGVSFSNVSFAYTDDPRGAAARRELLRRRPANSWLSSGLPDPARPRLRIC